MAATWGAPGGIELREAGNREALQSGLQAQKMMGDILAQPAEREYKQSLARAHTADAQAKEAEVRASENLRATQMRFLGQQQEEEARGAAAKEAEGQGFRATVADLPQGKLLTKSSQADPLEQFANYASKTIPPMELAKLRSEIAGIRQKEAAAGASNATAAKRQFEVDAARYEQVGNIAGAAAQSEANYNAIMLGRERGLLPPQLSGNYRTDLPILRAIELASQDSIKRAKLKLDTLESESKRRLDQSNQGRIAATVENLKLRGKQLKQDAILATKAGGKYSPEALEYQKMKSENLKSQIEARKFKTFLPLPLDAGQLDVGKVFTLADGRLARVVGVRADGKPRLMEYHSGVAPVQPGAADEPDDSDVTEGADDGEY